MRIRLNRLAGTLAAAALFVLLLSGCGSEAEGSGVDKVKLKIADISTNITFRVALEKGFSRSMAWTPSS